MSQRSVIVGMNNPISMRPEHALYPHPAGCAGWRLWKMLNEESGASKHEYLDAFERVNVLTGKWIKAEAHRSAVELQRAYTGRTILLLGRDVQQAFDAPKDLSPLDCYRHHASLVPRFTTTFYLVPHPSGRNTWYNAEGNRRMVAALLGRLYREHKR